MRNLKTFEARNISFKEKGRLLVWITTSKILSSKFGNSQLRTYGLRVFGAKIGIDCTFKSGIRILYPWNLEIGDDCWIGEEVWFINHEKITIGSNVCVSQRSIICSGGHDYRSASLAYAHKPVFIKDGAWICLDAKVLPGVTIGECSVVSAGEIARKSLPDYSMLVDGQVRQIEPPK